MCVIHLSHVCAESTVLSAYIFHSLSLAFFPRVDTVYSVKDLIVKPQIIDPYHLTTFEC